ncbi:class R serpentine receptor [Crossiella sp. S99.2]|uniref:class R serpentine receptor n=1 Tax=Crossiella sp. S99.2 TaxID=2936272 RepID=UPI001FFF9C46|nr:class R serpentine receptor [Crossiella sp. S99.2]MCK2238080.1 class R serpentine receptor [Crossiella sp. S99.2]
MSTPNADLTPLRRVGQLVRPSLFAVAMFVLAWWLMTEVSGWFGFLALAAVIYQVCVWRWWKHQTRMAWHWHRHGPNQCGQNCPLWSGRWSR